MSFLRLAQPAQQVIIKHLDHIDRLALSTCSKRTKSVVKTCKLSLAELDIHFANYSEISLTLRDGFIMTIVLTDAQIDGSAQSDRPQTIQFLNHRDKSVRVEWRGLNFDVGTWIRHLQSVYYCSKVSSCAFTWRNDIFDVGSIKRALAGVEIQSAKYFDSLSEQNFRQLLNSEILSEYVTIWGDRYRDESGLRKLLNQNLSVFSSEDHFPLYFSRLDNILAINSRTINMRDSRLSSKNLNRFLKLWKTGSMPRLEFLELFTVRNHVIDKNEILRGVKHVVNPRNQKSHSKVENLNGRQSVCISGGIVITRNDGAKAIIGIKPYMFNLYLLK